VEFEVQLNSIPPINRLKLIGREVVARWSFLDFDNEDVFYTDSNGLEMQKRTLNSRPDFDLSTDMKVSSNYYPVNQAIAMRNSANKQVTIMNTRSQGGGVIEKGAIELM